MGHKHSNVKVNAKVTLHGTSSIVDGLKLSYKSSSCCGGRRVLAAFTFPKGGWRHVSEDVLQNYSSKGVNVPLKRLQKKDGDTSVRITFLAGGSVPVYKTEMALADFLGGLRCTMRGREALLLFNLSEGKVNDGKVDGHVFTTLFCNGRRCGEAPRVEAPHRPPADGGGEVEDGEGEDSPGVGEDGEGVAESPGLRGDGQGLEDSPSVGEESEGMGDSPGLGGEGQELDYIPRFELEGEGEDVAPEDEERTGCYNEEVPLTPCYYVATPSSYGSGGQGRGALINTLGISATVVVFILMFYNAWLEWNKS